jgi:hypothetical protein
MITFLRACLGVLLAAALVAVAAPAAAGAGQTAGDQARRCSFRWSSAVVTKNLVDFAFTQTCGKSLRAWRRWGGSDIDLGTYRKTDPSQGVKHSVACDVTSCQGHPDGAPFCWGYQRKDTGQRIKLGGC